ncbi:auxilin-like clathrin-binding protein required for normal clathrin function [Thecaphora frezii]
MDDLLDLDWKQPPAITPSSSSSSSSKTTNNNLPNLPNPSSSNSYSFDSLTRSLHAPSPSPTPHSNSPFYNPSSPPLHPPPPRSYPPSSSTKPTPPPTSATPTTSATNTTTTTHDAFSSLLSFGNASASRAPSHDANLTMAERQRRAHQHAHARSQAHQQQQDSAWAGLDSAWADTSTLTPHPQRPLAPPPAPSKSPQPPAPAADPWDFDALSHHLPAKPVTSNNDNNNSNNTSRPPARTGDPFDFNSFDRTPSTSSAPHNPAFDAFDDYNGVAETAHIDSDHNNDDDDILGVLAKPIAQHTNSHATLHPGSNQTTSISRASTVSSSVSSRQPSPASGSRPAYTRAVSPPPHILGQIVEMGFSPQQARSALAQTESGLDVQAALELLMVGTGEVDQQHEADERLAEQLQRQEAAADSDADAELKAYEAKEAERRRRRRMGPSRDATGASEADVRNTSSNPWVPSRNATPSSQVAASEWQQQADQLYAQASEIGANMLGKASAFWSSAKAQAQKALEERQRASALEAERSSSPAGSARRWGVGVASAKKHWEGKPRWMVEAEAAAAEDEAQTSATPVDGAFKDSDDEGAEEATQATQHTPAETKGNPFHQPTADLWDDGAVVPVATEPRAASKASPGLAAPTEAKRPYISPNRRGPTRPAATAAVPAETPKVYRQVPDDEPASVAASGRHKAEGNEHFKKGAYGEAESCYTRGIEALSAQSLRLVPLLNNRANARLKNGSAAAAIEDCEAVLRLIQAGALGIYRPSGEHPLPAELARDVNLRDAYAKALLRKAQACEALEKWQPADQAWELLLDYEKREGSGASGVNNMRFARDGAARCGKMLGRASAPAAAVSPPVKPRSAKPPAATVSSSSPSVPGERLQAHQALQATQEAEDAERLALKDGVEERLTAWRGGKEANLRALIASVDTMAWPALGWKKVGMHELVTDAQVKKAYVRAIAKVHPDKLTPNNTTVEQRMLAAGIFNGLNEAWNASQK